MAWDDIRRTVQYIANLRAASAKVRALNRILPGLQDEFETALLGGTLLALEPGHFEEIDRVLTEELDAA